MLDVVGVSLSIVDGVGPAYSWPFIGESVKNCCWMTGSTDAATEFVERATLRRTFNAIQSLHKTEHVSLKIRSIEIYPKKAYSRKSLRIWNAPKAGSLRMVYQSTPLFSNDLETEDKSDETKGTHEVPHDLTSHVAPTDQDASG